MKIATIGTGFIVDRFIQAAQLHTKCEIHAVYSRSLENAKNFADKYGISKTFDCLNSMLSDPIIDCIYVASPNSLHYTQTKMALLAGKHVICEKPFTTTTKELQELIDIAKKTNCFLFEAIIPIHLPNYKWMKSQLLNLGEIKMVQCNFSQYSSRYDAFKRGEKPNIFNPEFSGGAIMDLNIYGIHFVMGLFGTPKDAHYYANIENGVDTSGVIILEYPGFLATCVACKDSKSLNRSQIQGTKGFFTIEQEPSRIVSIETHLANNSVTYSNQEISNGMYYELLDFIQIIENHDYAECYSQLDYSYEVLKVVEKARKKAGISFSDDES